MNSLVRIFYTVLLGIVLFSCKNKRKPYVQYMPDMYESVAYEPYADKAVFKGGMEALQPVEGTIPRGHIPYEYPDSEEGYQAAKKDLISPLVGKEIDEKKAETLYTMYCAICHGKKGDGMGTLTEREKFLGIPSYKDRDITQGSIYHVIMYGRNLMGSHASQLTEKERWLVVHHVEKLRNKMLK